MKQMELLAPAGDFNSLKVAVYNGADAVYLGVNQFNARNNIKGFDLDNLADAVDFAHLFGVKVYLALNILFTDEEMQRALDIVVDANNMGVDAFIVQDLGLVGLIRKQYPSIELHASTQMAVHNLEGVQILQKLGFKRVVLARETPKQEIERIRDNSDIEIEFFVQGALCVSFSGNCYMCSHLTNKSGNRGLCQQFCRLPYTFEACGVTRQGFLLSAKDICMLDELDTLSNLNVTSLKIEGRARRPFYVAQACRVYRKVLDGKKYSAQDLEALKIAFNRDYTPAYFNGNDKIISQIQGNNGLEIGVVTKVNKGKKFNEIFIDSKYNLKSKCGLKFIYNGEEIGSIGAYDVHRVGKMYRVTTTSNVFAGCKVNLIQDNEFEQQVLSRVRKLDICIKCEAKIDKPMKLIAVYNDIVVDVESEFACLEAKTISISCEQLLKQLARSEYFNIYKFEADIDGIYMLNSSINKLRNQLYDKLINRIIEKFNKPKLHKITLTPIISTGINKFDFKIIDAIDNLYKCDNIIFEYTDFNESELLQFNTYCEKQNINGYIDLPNFATGDDIKLITRILNKTSLGVVANNIYALNFDTRMIGGQFLNVYNSYTLQTLQELHQLQAGFIEEVETKSIESAIPLLKREKVYMTLLHCPFKQNIGCDCSNCGYTNSDQLTINSGKRFQIVRKKTASCIFLLKDGRC